MASIPTPHIGAQKDDIAKTVIMPGDPLRAKFISENLLQDVKCFTKIRNMYGFTGYYNGTKVSVMGSGMGIPSIGIYSYELFNFYDVNNIIRIGTAGGISEDLKLKDIVIGMGACTDSNYINQFDLPGIYAPIPSFKLLKHAVQNAEKLNLNVHIGNILSSDAFYVDIDKKIKPWAEVGVLAVEMEASALYFNAAKAKKNALCILTVSNFIFREGQLSSLERQENTIDMAKLALSVAESVK